MRNFISRCIFVLLFSQALIPGLGCADEKAKPTTIGAILPLSGPLAMIGQEMQQGMELAIDELNGQFIAVYEDDQTANRITALSAAKNLVSVKKVDVVYNAYAGTIAAISPTLKQAQMPCVVIWDSNKSLPALGEHVFGFGFSNELAGEDMAEFAVKRLKKTKAAVVGLHNEWSELIAESFSERFKALGGKVVVTEMVNFDATDFRSILGKVRAAKAEVVYFPLFGPGMENFIKQARELKLDAALLTGDGMSDSETKNLGAAAEGVYASQLWLEDEAFKEKYVSKFGSQQTTGVNLGYVALAYDSVKMLGDLKKQVEESKVGFTSAAILQKLPGFRFNGVLGEVQFSAERSTQRKEKVLVVRKGEFQVAGEE